jgi:hypothetical protein
MAMAEGERTECAEPPRDEPPADSALKRAEELKTQANDYFKGASGPDGEREEWTATQAKGVPGPRGTMATRSSSLGAGQALPSDRARGGPGRSPPRGDLGGFRGEGQYFRTGVLSGSY